MAKEIEIGTVVACLEGVLSRRLTAYIAGVQDGRLVDEWASDIIVPNQDQEDRLRGAFQIVLFLQGESETDEMIKAFFIGMNPWLGDHTPAEYIHSGNWEAALAAAQSMISGGYS